MRSLIRKPRFRGVGLLSLAAVVAIVIAGCGSSSSKEETTSANTSSAGGKSGASTNKVSTIAVVTPAKTNDYGWNEQGYDAAKEAAGKVGAKVELTADIGYERTPSVLKQVAAKKPGLLIAHASGFDTAAQRVAEETGVPTVTYDIGSMKSPGKLSNITTSSQEGGYLAGILAAKMTKTKHIGVIISASDTNWFEMTGGYAAGAHSVNPSLEISFAEIGPEAYDDAAGGKRVAESMIATGADVIFGMGDDASFGYLQAIETAKAGHKVWYIGDIGNMTPIDKNHVLLSSVLWNFTGAYEKFIQEINEGTFGQEGYNLTLANGGISLLKTSYIPSSTWSEIESAKTKIIGGEIKVPEDTKMEQVKETLKG